MADICLSVCCFRHIQMRCSPSLPAWLQQWKVISPDDCWKQRKYKISLKLSM